MQHHTGVDANINKRIKNGEKEFADFDNAIQSAKRKGFKIGYSNDAFELWFYLHYHYTDCQNHRKFYYDKLGEKWDINYEKHGKTAPFCRGIYQRLLTDPSSNQRNAISNAKKLHQKHKDLIHSKRNPITTVYLLVEELNKYLKGNKHS